MIFVHDRILKDNYDGTFIIKTRQLVTGLWTPGSYLSLYMPLRRIWYPQPHFKLSSFYGKVIGIVIYIVVVNAALVG
jgi:hypothetical protein